MERFSRIVGRPVARIDARRKAAGQQRFMSDIVLSNALWAAVVRSPHARANVRAIDPQPALEMSGVVAVFTAEDVPDILFNTAGEPPSEELAAAADRRLLTSAAQHIGDGVAVVVARTRAEALAATRGVSVDWEVLAPVLDPEDALAQGEVLGQVGWGEATDAPFATADLIVEGRYYTPAVQHVCLEPHACAAFFDSADSRLTIWSNTQTPSDLRRLCSEILGVPLARLRVRKLDEGGGFGCKQELFEEALVAWLAMRLRRPIQLQYTRQEEFTASRGRHGARVDVRLGFDRDGRLLACDLDALLDSGAYASHAPYVIGNILCAAYYTYPHAAYHLQGAVVKTNTLTGGAYRGYGAPQALFAVEQAMDVAAQRLGIDPVELRRRNTTVDAEPDPFFGPHAAGRLRKCLDAGADLFGWTDTTPAIGKDGFVRAQGMAVATMLNTTNIGVNEETSAVVRLNEDGTATLITGTCDCGTGSSTVLAQIVAEELRLPVGAVDVREGDTDSGLVDIGSFAQRTVFVGGGAARQASIAARERLLDAVALIEGRSREQLALADGRIVDCCDATFDISIEEFCRSYASRGSIVGTASYRPDDSPPGYSVCFVQVAVDLETGAVQIERCMNAVDCGSVLNPLGAAGQVHGGVVQGLGFARIELWSPDAHGAGPLTIEEHGIPGALDVPGVLALFIDTPETAGPYGAKGVGELPVPPVAPAVANAVARATGVRFNRLPLRPAEVWQKLSEKGV